MIIKEWIVNNLLQKNNAIKKRWRLLSIEELKEIPEFKEFYKIKDVSIIQNAYMYFNDINEVPLCPICKNPLKFINWNVGFTRFCSSSCANKSEQTKLKIKNTNKLKYGVSTYLITNDCIEKRKQINLENLGVEHQLQSNIVQLKIKETKNERYNNPKFNNRTKAKETLLDKYNVVNCFQLEEIKNKIKETCLERYGVNNTSKIENVKRKQILSRKYNNFEKHLEVLLNNKKLKLLTEKKMLYDVDELEFECLLCR